VTSPAPEAALPKYYEDGTVRLTKSDLSPQDQIVLLKYADLYHFHDDGDINIELTAAEHDALYERRAKKEIKKNATWVPHRPTNCVGVNSPCPCGNLSESGRPVKYKRCCLRTATSFAPARQEETHEDTVTGDTSRSHSASEEDSQEVIKENGEEVYQEAIRETIRAFSESNRHES
jgi:hypothetical protein